MFRPAVKENARARVALVGVPGGGKSYTGLKLARLLAGPSGKIAAIDTEHGSLSKYAAPRGEKADNKNYFEFDVVEFDEYSVENWLAAHEAARRAGYSVLLTDSLSHFWMGTGGALEFVDKMKAQVRDQMDGWKKFRPHERQMVDTMIASPMHIIVTMRTKNDYVTQIDERGREKRVKVGLAPVQREGLEYEFDFVGTLDEENTLVVNKTRCPWYRENESRAVITRPTYAYFKPFVDWLSNTDTQVPEEPRGGPVMPAIPAPAECPPASRVSADNPPTSTDTTPSGEVDSVPPPSAPEPKAEVAPTIDEIPAEILGVLNLIGKPGGTTEAFSIARATLVRELPNSGEAVYRSILARHGIKQSGNVKREVWNAVRECLETAEQARRAAEQADMAFADTAPYVEQSGDLFAEQGARAYAN